MFVNVIRVLDLLMNSTLGILIEASIGRRPSKVVASVVVTVFALDFISDRTVVLGYAMILASFLRLLSFLRLRLLT